MNSPDQPSAHSIESRFPTLALWAAACAAALFAGLASWHGIEGIPNPPLEDAYIFQQYGRAIAEGHPYRFSANDPPSTASTSHTYPFVLAAFYFAGARGVWLAPAAMLFGAGCFLLSVAAVWTIARTLTPRAAPLAALLMALQGQQVFAHLGGTDMAMFAPLALWALAAGLKGRLGWMAALLAACAWTRPEGAILSGLALAAAVLPPRPESPDQKKHRRGLALAGLAGLASYGGVMALNFWLTGMTTFHSVIGKGRFAQQPLIGALIQTVADWGELARGLVLGLEGGGRQFYAIPVLGAALMAWGLARPSGRDGWKARLELWWIASALVASFLAVSSAWGGIHHDRYFAWCLPVALIYMAAGAEALAARLPLARPRLWMAGALLGWELLGLAYFGGRFAWFVAATARKIEFCEQADRLLPPGARIGAMGGGGIAGWHIQRRSVLNFQGFQTPIFATPERGHCNTETIKHHPEWRFEVWLRSETKNVAWLEPFMGPALLEQPSLGLGEAMLLQVAQWDALEGISEPLSEKARQAVAGLERIDSLDVGYLDDERRLNYSIRTDIPALRLAPFVHAGRLAGREIAEAGRLTLGSESFRLRVQPGKRLRAVARSISRGRPSALSANESNRPIQPYPPKVAALVDGVPVAKISFEPPKEEAGAPEDFFEIIFDLPAQALVRDEIEIELLGDHFSFAYWFYQ
jgi:hypothetical protein